MEFNYQLKIPKERIAVIIGKSGETKKMLEEEGKIQIDVDSEEGIVSISSDDSIGLFTMKGVVAAIGRGFNPEIAKYLLKTDYAFELLNLNDYAQPGQHGRLKGRVIGAKGKGRETVEQLTECSISVYGKTIGIIGRQDNCGMAKKAVEMLLEGSLHKTVYAMLEKWRRQANY